MKSKVSQVFMNPSFFKKQIHTVLLVKPDSQVNDSYEQ